MPSLTARQSYRTFGALYAVTIAIVLVLRSLAAEQLLVGSAAGLVLGGLGLAVFWWLGNNHHEANGSAGLEISVRGWVGSRESIERIGRVVTSVVWFLGVYLIYAQGVRLGVPGIVAITCINCVLVWNAAVAVPPIERWLKSGS